MTSSSAQERVNFHYYKKGLTYKSQGDYEAAAKEFTVFVHHNPTHAKARYYRGYCYLYNGDYEKALDDFMSLAELQPSNVDGHYGAGVAAYRLKQYNVAKHHFDQVLTIDPFHVHAEIWIEPKGLVQVSNGIIVLF